MLVVIQVMSKYFLTVSFVALSFFLQAKTIVVCSSCEFTSIEEAIESGISGDVIQVKKGHYSCSNLELHYPVSLIGESGVVLDGEGGGYVLKIFSDDVYISNFTIIGTGRSYTKDYAAVYAFNVSNFRIENNVVRDSFFGFLIEKSKGGFIEGNKLYGSSKKESDSGNGIHLWHCKNINIVDNMVHKMRDGIYLEFLENSNVQGNYTFENVRYGLHFMFSNNNQYAENTFENNGAGVAIMFSKKIIMKNNKFLKNWGTASYGLLLKEIYDAEVVNNLFSENTTAIHVEGASRVNYRHNRVISNGWAVKISGGCYANIFVDNNFIGNAFDLSFNAKKNDNKFDSNYWSSYRGYDLNRDGIGDIPYRPIKLFSYLVNRTPETIVLLRSLFIDIINFSETISPIFIPNNLLDNNPRIKPWN